MAIKQNQADYVRGYERHSTHARQRQKLDNNTQEPEHKYGCLYGATWGNVVQCPFCNHDKSQYVFHH